MSYYKIMHGFTPEEYIEIDESELEKAFYAFLQKKDAIFSGGAIKGSLIQSIKPDYHRVMGWNRGYKLEVEDFEELSNKGIDRKMQNILIDKKERVQFLIEKGRENLIGKNTDIPELKMPEQTPQIARIGGMKSIGGISRIGD